MIIYTVLMLLSLLLLLLLSQNLVPLRKNLVLLIWCCLDRSRSPSQSRSRLGLGLGLSLEPRTSLLHPPGLELELRFIHPSPVQLILGDVVEDPACHADDAR